MMTETRKIISLWAALASLCVTACDGREVGSDQSRDANAVSAAPPPPGNQAAAGESRASIMRPSVVEEAAQPAPPAPAEPFRATILFESGAELGPEAKAKLDEAAAALARSDAAVVLRGHSDSKGDDADNKLTSQKRAEAVRDYLVEKGVAEERLTIVALGEARPAAPNANLDGSDNEEGRRRNRRVEVVAETEASAAEAPDVGNGSADQTSGGLS